MITLAAKKSGDTMNDASLPQASNPLQPSQPWRQENKENKHNQATNAN
jgi:hypothetical protein